MSDRNSRKWFFFAFIWFAGSVYALLFRAAESGPPPFPHFDKFCHFALFFGQFWLAAKGFFIRPQAIPYRLLLSAAVIWAATSEMFQAAFTATRRGDILDFGADIAGAAAALWLAKHVAAARRAAQTNEQDDLQ